MVKWQSKTSEMHDIDQKMTWGKNNHIEEQKCQMGNKGASVGGLGGSLHADHVICVGSIRT